MCQLLFHALFIRGLLLAEKAQRRISVARLAFARGGRYGKLVVGIHHKLRRGPRRLFHKARQRVFRALLHRGLLLRLHGRGGFFLLRYSAAARRGGVPPGRGRRRSGRRGDARGRRRAWLTRFAGIHAEGPAGTNDRLLVLFQFSTADSLAANVDINGRTAFASAARGFVGRCIHVEGRDIVPGGQRMPPRFFLSRKAGLLGLLCARFAQLGTCIGAPVHGILHAARMAGEEVPDIRRRDACEQHQTHQHEDHNEDICPRAAAQQQQRPAEHRAQHAAAEPPFRRAGAAQHRHALPEAQAREVCF